MYDEPRPGHGGAGHAGHTGRRGGRGDRNVPLPAVATAPAAAPAVAPAVATAAPHMFDFGSGCDSKASALAIGDAFRLMSQVLMQMQEAMESIDIKTDRTDETVRAVATHMKAQNKRLLTVEDRLKSVENTLNSYKSVRTLIDKEVDRVEDCAVDKSMETEFKQLSTETVESKHTTSETSIGTKDMFVQVCMAKDGRLEGEHLSKASFSVSTTCPSPSLTRSRSPSPLPSTTPRRKRRSRFPAKIDLSMCSMESSHSAPSTSVSRTSPQPSRAPLLTQERPRSASMGQQPGRKLSEELGRGLLKAAQEGRAKELRRLVRRGANVDYPNGSKWTALHKAAAKGQVDAVQVLLELGADVNARTSYGFTALHFATHNDRTGACVQRLLRAGADVDRRNQFGRTPLHYAVECGNERAARLLIEAGANVHAPNDEGKTPLDLAKMQCLRKYMAVKGS